MGVLESHVPWMIRGACEQGAGCLMELDGFLLVSVPSESPRRQVVSQGIQGDGSSVAQREALQTRGHPGRIIRAHLSLGRVRARGDRAVTAVRRGGNMWHADLWACWSSGSFSSCKREVIGHRLCMGEGLKACPPPPPSLPREQEMPAPVLPWAIHGSECRGAAEAGTTAWGA